MGPYSVKTGQIVYVNDSDLLLAPLNGKGPVDGQGKKRRLPEIELRLYMDLMGSSDLALQLQHEAPTEAFIDASTAMFGADPSTVDPQHPIRFGHGEGVRLVRDPSNPLGCEPYKQRYAGEAIVVRRGDCTFLDKLFEAAVAGASGVVVISDENSGINPSADAGELQAVGDLLDDVVAVVVSRDDGEMLTAMMDAADSIGTGQVMVAVSPTPETTSNSHDASIPPDEAMRRARDSSRVLYLNGHPLINTRLLV